MNSQATNSQDRQWMHDLIKEFIKEIQQYGGPTYQQVTQAQYVYNKFLASPDYSEAGIWRIARAVAILSFRPMGITYDGKHYHQIF
jgi:hypothetical protein